MLFALVLLQACGSAPTVLTEVDFREVKVGVRTPLPDDCFEQHAVDQQAKLPADGPMLFKSYTTWADALVTVVSLYRAQATRCDDLNRADPEAPSEES